MIMMVTREEGVRVGVMRVVREEGCEGGGGRVMRVVWSSIITWDDDEEDKNEGERMKRRVVRVRW